MTKLAVTIKCKDCGFVVYERNDWMRELGKKDSLGIHIAADELQSHKCKGSKGSDR